MKCRYFCRLPLDISPVYLTRGISPEDAPKKYTEKADCTDGNQLCEKWFWHKVPSFNMYEM